MDYESFLSMEGKEAVKAAVDAFFLEVKQLFEDRGITQESLDLLGEELGGLAKVVYGVEGSEEEIAGLQGPSRVLRKDPDGMTLVQVRFTSPREPHALHEHRAWYVLRVIKGQEYYCEWARLDDGSREGYAELQQGERHLLGPGDVLTALAPVIHLHEDYQEQTCDELMLLGENPGDKPFRRFDPEARTVFESQPRNYDKL
ncbi:MAG: hypothetical protein JRG79_06105 [Deltaproteobacteria bacterium]|nr:hypothetical protein [Deltaproteobacteria bacterium]